MTCLPEDHELRLAGELYVESSEAQHGDVEVATWDAELWRRIFREVATRRGTDEDQSDG